MPDISMIAIFARQGMYGAATVASLNHMIRSARRSGLAVEMVCVLNHADDLTREVATHLDCDSLAEIHESDSGMARNTGIDKAGGEYVAIFEAADLWGEPWLLRALQAARNRQSGQDVAWHPQVIYSFDEGDFDCPAENNAPGPLAKSRMAICTGSDAAGFDPRALFLHNPWSPTVFARRTLFTRFPFESGLTGVGQADWNWNIRTLQKGACHGIVPSTVHLRRILPPSFSSQAGNFLPDCFPSG